MKQTVEPQVVRPDRCLAHDTVGTDVLSGYSAVSRSRNAWATTVAYLSLLKLRSVVLNVFSALTGVFLAVGSRLEWETTVLMVVSLGLVAAGSGAVNSYLDRDIDRMMPRTSRRALPAGRIWPPEKAALAGLALIALGLAVSVAWLNLVTMLFIAFGAAIYIFVYTMWLKRRTPWSVVVGGLAGSCALLAGWSSTGSSFGLLPLAFATLIFLWTPGHYWGLAIWANRDSQGAGIPTLPALHGERKAARWAALSSVATVAFSAVPVVTGVLGATYLLIVGLSGLVVIAASIWLWRRPTPQRAWMTFKLSSPYLAVIYLAAIIDALLV